MPDYDKFFTAVLAKMNLPATPWRLEFFREWTYFESGHGEWAAEQNPLNTTLHMPGDWDIGHDPTQNGGNPVRSFPSFDVGVQATFLTLTNGYYTGVIRTLLNQQIDPSLSANIRIWGSTSFADYIDGGWKPVSLAAMTLEQRIDRLERLVAANGARDKNGIVLRGEAALQDQAARGNSIALGLALGQDRDVELATSLAGILSGDKTFEAVLDALQTLIDKARK